MLKNEPINNTAACLDFLQIYVVKTLVKNLIINIFQLKHHSIFVLIGLRWWKLLIRVQLFTKQEPPRFLNSCELV